MYGRGWDEPPWAALDSLVEFIIRIRHWRRERQRRRRRKLGLCYWCGYDVRAQKPGDRCPECGKYPVNEPRPRVEKPGDWPEIEP